MENLKKIVVVILFSALLYFSYLHFVGGNYLRFSDGAKFGLIAKNILIGNGYTTDFSFFGTQLFGGAKEPVFYANAVPMAMPLSIFLSFKVFGVNDLAVIHTSGFYYLVLVVGVYLLGKKIYGSLVGFLSSVAVAANINFLDYATSGASEVLFSAVGVISVYLLFLKKTWSDVLFFVSVGVLYFIRPQAIVFIGGVLFAWLLIRFSFKKALAFFIGIFLSLLSIDWFVLYPLSYTHPVYPIIIRGIQAIFQYSPTESVSNALRGEAANVVTWSAVVKKSFYNIYNFYKLLPQIASPYMWGLFLLGIMTWKKITKEARVFQILTIIIVSGTFLLTAITIPFFRYLHPVVPFVYIIATAAVIKFCNTLFDKKFIPVAAFFVISIFTLGQTLGAIFLDSRFSADNHNLGKPPIYASFSKILQDNTQKNQVIVTNLDTWGSWYGDRKTVWYPLEPKMLINPKDGKIPFDGIYLTSYLIDDENYYMGDSWRQIFLNPNDPKKWACDGCSEIAKEFTLKGVYKINSTDVYDKTGGTSILLIKKPLK